MQYLLKLIRSSLVAALTFVSIISSSSAQSLEPPKLENCAPATDDFVDQRESEIREEIISQSDQPIAGYYSASSEGGSHFILAWARSGFIVYMLPDYPCTANVSYGTAIYRKNRLTLKPVIAFAPKLKFIFARKYRVVQYHKKRYLVPIGKLNIFYREKRLRIPAELGHLFLEQREFETPEWRKYRMK